MKYDYTHCFWDPRDEGATILLQHIANGLKSTQSIVNLFKWQSELDKDFTRRASAANDKFIKDTQAAPEYGNLSSIYNKLSTYQSMKSKSYAKHSELLHKLYIESKDFLSDLTARYTTLTGKVERMRIDKLNKKKHKDELLKQLKAAQTKARDLTLNIENTIASKKTTQHHQKELKKWQDTEHELDSQLDVLIQEYKAAQKYWLQEWATVSSQFQALEVQRIQFVQEKLQAFLQSSSDTTILEQTKLDQLTLSLSSFNAMDDIESFARSSGTGRLKEKKVRTHSHTHSHSHTHPQDLPRLDPSHSLNTRVSSRDRFRESMQFWQSSDSETSSPVSATAPAPTPQSFRPSPPPSRKYTPPSMDLQHFSNTDNLQLPKRDFLNSSSNSASSNINSQTSSHVDSLATSISSMNSTIVERFSKSWNSKHNDLPLSPETTGSDIKRQTLHLPKHDAPFTSSSERRRKSMVFPGSTTPIEDALYEMNKMQNLNLTAKEDHSVGRIRDSGITVTLPIVTSDGHGVIQYAKALYPLVDNPATELAHFHKGDYLLLTHIIDKDWYKGEVYANDMIDATHKYGLIPSNFVRLLK